MGLAISSPHLSSHTAVTPRALNSGKHAAIRAQNQRTFGVLLEARCCHSFPQPGPSLGCRIPQETETISALDIPGPLTGLPNSIL